MSSGRGVGGRAAARLDRLLGDHILAFGALQVAVGGGIDLLHNLRRCAGRRHDDEPGRGLKRRMDRLLHGRHVREFADAAACVAAAKIRTFFSLAKWMKLATRSVASGRWPPSKSVTIGAPPL